MAGVPRAADQLRSVPQICLIADVALRRRDPETSALHFKTHRHNDRRLAAVIVVALSWPSGCEASTYLFHLSCTDRVFVAEWDTGAIDPGREYFRRLTESKHENCLVGSFDESRDANLPDEKYSFVSGAVQGVPVLGPVVCGFLGCTK